MSKKFHDRFPTYDFYFPKPIVKIDFHYNFFQKTEHQEIPEDYIDGFGDLIRPINHTGQPGAEFETQREKIPRYVEITIDMPNANIPFADKALPWFTGHLNENEQLYDVVPTAGQFLITEADLSSLLNDGKYNYEDSQTNPMMSNFHINDHFLLDRILLKSELLANLHGQEITTVRGLKQTAEKLGPSLKDDFIAANSIETRPGVTTVNSIKGIIKTDFITRASRVKFNANINNFIAQDYIDAVRRPSIQSMYLADKINSVTVNEQFRNFIGGHGVSISSYDPTGGGVMEAEELNMSVDLGTADVDILDFSNEIPYIAYENAPTIKATCLLQQNATAFRGDRFDYYLVGFKINRTPTGLDGASGTKKTFFVNTTVSIVNETTLDDETGGVNAPAVAAGFRLRGFYPEVQTRYKFIDTEIAYGETYTYEVEPVFSFMTLESQRQSTAELITGQSIQQALAQLGPEAPIEGVGGPGAFGEIGVGAFIGENNETTIETNQRWSQVFWVGSGDLTSIKAIDRVPPPCPTSLKFNIYMNNGMPELRIKWQHSTSKQKDIKYYQVFRRESIREAYTLVGMLNFNDAEKPFPLYEVINEGVVDYCGIPKKFFFDPEFKIDREYYYAVCSVDAHGLTSNYSEQFYVKYSTALGKLMVRRISKDSAPKQYPNFFIDPEMDPDVVSNSLTQDYIGSSGKSRVTVYFDPDCRLAQSNERELVDDNFGGEIPSSTLKGQLVFKLKEESTDNIGEDDRGIYKIHFINTDRQLSDTFHIEINNSKEPLEDERADANS